MSQFSHHREYYLPESGKSPPDWLEAEPWQLESLNLNSDSQTISNYGGRNWDFDCFDDLSRCPTDSWVVVLGYKFLIYRKSLTCDLCGGDGLSPEGQLLKKSMGRNGGELSQKELDHLRNLGRVSSLCPQNVDEFNKVRLGFISFSHPFYLDFLAISALFLARAESQGIDPHCKLCGGNTTIIIPSEKAKLQVSILLVSIRSFDITKVNIWEVRQSDLDGVLRYIHQGIENNYQNNRNCPTFR